MAAQHAEPKRVFLNIPYDAKFERLYLAYIVGVNPQAVESMGLGVAIRVTVEFIAIKGR
jgi:hypothetical protein